MLWAEGLRTDYRHCLKSVRIRSFSGLYFPTFKLSLLTQSECGKRPTRKTPNTGNFHAVRNMQSTIDILTPVFSLYFQTRQNVTFLSICFLVKTKTCTFLKSNFHALDSKYYQAGFLLPLLIYSSLFIREIFKRFLKVRKIIEKVYLIFKKY